MLGGFRVEVTTLTNKKVVIEGCSAYDTIEELKKKYQDSEGVPPDQQSFWFPVPESFYENAQSATSFEWWPKVKDRLEGELLAAITASPLLKGENIPADDGSNMPAMSLGSVLAAREGGAPQYLPLPDLTLPCFMVLQLRPSPGGTDEKPSDGPVDKEEVRMPLLS